VNVLGGRARFCLWKGKWPGRWPFRCGWGFLAPSPLGRARQMNGPSGRIIHRRWFRIGPTGRCLPSLVRRAGWRVPLRAEGPAVCRFLHADFAGDAFPQFSDEPDNWEKKAAGPSANESPELRESQAIEAAFSIGQAFAKNSGHQESKASKNGDGSPAQVIEASSRARVSVT